MVEPVRSIEADVVVLGTGPAGMAAVSAAAEAGAEVAAVEAMEHIGGNAVWSTGYLAFVDSDMQREQGIVDDVEVFVDDARAMVDAARDQFGVEWDEALVRLFARESAQTYRILTERGVRFSRFIPRPRQHTVDRMAAVEDSWMLGRAFVADFERDNVTVAYRTVADRLVVEDGRVSGCSRTGPMAAGSRSPPAAAWCWRRAGTSPTRACGSATSPSSSPARRTSESTPAAATGT